MIHIDKVSKVFGTGVLGLSEITLQIEKGEFVFLVGQTGSGKTTLLKLLIRETLPTKGTITIADLDITKLPTSKIPHLRKKIGIIFQDLKLLMDRTILENVLLPLEITGVKVSDAIKRAEELLTQVGIFEHKDKFPIQLSGGELQRVAIARALTLTPEILLADEPTGNLDDKTAFEIVEILDNINKNGTTVIMATHNVNILDKYSKNRLVRLSKGVLIEDTKKPQAAVSKSQFPNNIQKGATVSQEAHKKEHKHIDQKKGEKK